MAPCRARAWKRRRCPPARARNARRNRMTTRTTTVGIIMNGVTGRMGLNQHLRRSIHAIIQQGGVRLSDSETHHAAPAAGGPQRRQAGGHLRASSAACRGPPTSMPALADPEYSIYFDAQTTDRRADGGAARPSPRASTSIAKSRSPTTWKRRCDLYRLAEAAGVKHGVVQDKLWLPGLLKLQTLQRAGLLRPHSLGARRIRLLGVRRRHRARAAPLLELPQGRRRRHHPRHALPLALRARQPLRRGEGRFLPGRHPHSRSAGTKPASPTSARPTIRPTPRSSWKAASWRTSIRPGACACAATTC